MRSTRRLRNRMRALVAVPMTALIAASALVAVSPADAAPPTPAYDLANGCFTISSPNGKPIPGTGPSTAKAAGLGRFLLYDTARKVLTARGTNLTRSGISHAGVWTIDRTGSTYRLTAPKSTGGATHTVRLTPATGCRPYPEAELNVRGTPHTGTDAQGNLAGFVDSHAHIMAEQFLGGELHCGKPFSPLGIVDALKDCADHGSDGTIAVADQVLGKFGGHDTMGWPTFKGYPTYYSLTHEQTYYRWLERTWRSGLRVINNYYVQNRALCEIYPLNSETCNEMESVRVQHRRMLKLRDYIDAQAGGPGRGFFQIATSAADIRRIVGQGKLAVTLGIEISEPFGCGQINGKSRCTKADIDRGLDELKALGVRQVILTHKFDNALGGARMDSDLIGVGVETGQAYLGGGVWQTEQCGSHGHDNRAPQDLTGPIKCNVRGLTPLGQYAAKATMDRNMIVDVDHLSAKAAHTLLTMIEKTKYPGVVSSHTWTDPMNYRRILNTGGAVGLYASSAERTPGVKHWESFIDQWRIVKKSAPKGKLFGLGFGPDMNGLGAQAKPREQAKTNPVRYPFTMPDGTVVDRQRTGVRVFDVNTDGTAHYGVLPDWIESLRIAAGRDGEALVADLYRAVEVYAQMWERVEGYTR